MTVATGALATNPAALGPLGRGTRCPSPTRPATAGGGARATCSNTGRRSQVRILFAIFRLVPKRLTFFSVYFFYRRPPGVPSAAPGPGLPGLHGQDGPDASLVLGGLPAPGARLPGLPALGAAHQPGVAGRRGGRRGLRGAAGRLLLRQDALARLVVHHGRPEVRKLSSLELRHSRR